MAVPPYDQRHCASRDCQDYDPSQMWYWSPTDGRLRAATYVASINHRDEGAGYVLTPKPPTWRHHCLAHVLSTGNRGTQSGAAEVWGGPLSGGDFVVACLNRGSARARITAPFELLEVPGASEFAVRDLWTGKDLGVHKGALAVEVQPHDIEIFRLTPPHPRAVRS